MNEKTKRFSLMLLFAIVNTVLLVITLAAVILILIFSESIGTVGSYLVVILMVIAIGFGIAVTLLVKHYLDNKKFNEQIRIENSYTLGAESLFYNLDAFKTEVTKLNKRRYYKNRQQFLVSFSPTGSNVVGGTNRGRLLQSLNQSLAKFIDKMFFDKSTEFQKKNYVYCFDRNAFLFYCYVNDENEIHSLIGYLSNECFRLVNEEKVKIWVQPFFGICKVEEDSSLTANIENALIAKTQSEKNIESYSYFKPAFMSNDTAVADDILKGIENGEFIPYYQAKFSLREKRFVSSEVLARWKTPDGIIGPSKFIERAERSGLLNVIDMSIFESAMKDLGDNIKRGRRVMPVSVNFSLYEFFSKNFLNHIVDTLQKFQVPPTMLEIEITETTSQVNKFLSLSVIKKLKDIGVRILMDDFGIGFSQIENLRQIPFDAVKIDKSFTDKIVGDEKSRTIVKFLIELIHSNDMEAIIEGVETKEQVDLLRKMKADTIQGFYYSRPIPFDSFNELLKANNFEKEVK